MQAIGQKLNRMKESAKKAYKGIFADLVFMKPFNIEVVFFCHPMNDEYFSHFKRVANISDGRYIGCEVGKSGEFIAKYIVRAEDRNHATSEGQKIYDLMRRNLGKNFRFKHYQVK